jgi:hypothetical protein
MKTKSIPFKKSDTTVKEIVFYNIEECDFCGNSCDITNNLKGRVIECNLKHFHTACKNCYPKIEQIAKQLGAKNG